MPNSEIVVDLTSAFKSTTTLPFKGILTVEATKKPAVIAAGVVLCDSSPWICTISIDQDSQLPHVVHRLTVELDATIEESQLATCLETYVNKVINAHAAMLI